jgi:predicted metalloprotease
VSGGVGVGGGGLLLLLLVMWLLGADPMALLQVGLSGGGAPGTTPGGAPAGPPPEDDTTAAFVEVVLADTEDTWGRIFANAGSRYPQPRLVLYTDAVRSACGLSSAATGPFYCPGDQQVYLDLGFLRELERLGAPGDFAFAYVIAHEVGHHVQKVTGIEGRVRELQSRATQTLANQLSVLMELQADCYAGIWANHAADMLEAGDLEEGLRAAAAIGDDRLQRMAGQRVAPESFTHGSSEQRVRWFRAGFDTGSLEACDTFAAAGVR